MKPIRISIKDFKSHRSTEIDCTGFKSILIVGKTNHNSRKSNGVGKTTIFHAIEYALFGVVPMKRLEKVIRNGANKCSVEFDFEIENQTYRVMRSRTRKGNRSDLRLYRMGSVDWDDITQKTSTETETELANLIKISHSAFRSSILFAQADLHGLASVTPRERKVMLKEPLQISIYNRYEKVAKEKVSLSLREVDRIKTLISAINNPEEDILKFKSELEMVQTGITALKSNKEKLSEQLSALKAQINIITLNHNLPSDDEIKAIERQINSTVIKIKGNSVYIAEKSAELGRLVMSKATFSKKIQEYRKEINNINTMNTQNRADIVDSINKLSSKEIDGKVYVSKLRADRKKIELPIPDGDECLHCRQTVTQQHRAICEAKRQTELVDLDQSIQKYSAMLESIQKKKAQFETALSACDANVRKIETLTNLINSSELELTHATKMIVAIKESIGPKEIENKELETTLSELRNKQDILDRRTADAVKESEPIKKINREIADIQQKLDKIVIDHNAATMNVGVLSEKIRNRIDDQAKLSILRTELLERENDYRMRLKVQQAFSSYGVPTMIINTILDDLQIVANDLMNQIRPGLEIVFSVAKTKSDGQQEDTLDIDYRINGVDHEYEQLSGGQKVMVALCLKFALSLIIQHRVGVDIKFLMLDEVDSQFDEESFDHYVEIIRKWQEKFTIFVISHNKDLKDKFKQAILVEGDDIEGYNASVTTNW